MTRPRLRRACVALLVIAPLAGCSAPTQQEYDAAIEQFRSLPDEAKAYACADDWYAVRLGVEGFVIVDECADGTGAPITRAEPLSTAFEQAELTYARDYYADNPPDTGLLRRVDSELLCGQSEQQVRAGIEMWREQTTFPSWNGVEYVPSTELEIERLRIWRDAACPLLEP